jgi:hypothetical protein
MKLFSSPSKYLIWPEFLERSMYGGVSMGSGSKEVGL